MTEQFSFLLNPPQVCVYILLYFPAQRHKSFLPVDSSVHDERVEKVATWSFFLWALTVGCNRTLNVLFSKAQICTDEKRSEIRRREKITPVAFYGCLAATADGRWGRGRWRLKKLSDYLAMTNKCECQKQAPSAAAWLVQRDKNSKRRLFCSPRRVADRKSDTLLPDRRVATVMGGRRGRLLTCNK